MKEEHLLLAALSGALIVLGGASYALFFALGRLHQSNTLLVSAYLSYAVLAASCLALAEALQLHGLWTGLIVVMLIGYLLTPRAVWHLCVGTHGKSDVQQSVEGRRP